MWLPHVAGALLLALGLIPRAAAGPVAGPVAVPAPFAEPAGLCPVECSTGICCNKICCASTQYCASYADSQCGEGPAIWITTTGGWVQFTSLLTITQTDLAVFTSTVVWSSALPGISGGISGGSGGVGTVWDTSSGFVTYPTGTNTFLLPATTITPTATGDVDFNSGGIIGGGSAPQGLTSAQIGGIVGGILGAFFLIALILFCCCMRRRGAGGAAYGSRRTTTTTTVVQSGSSSAGGGGGGFFGRHQGGRHHVVPGGTAGAHGSSSAKKTGMAALLGGAAAGLTSMFASRKAGRVSEKYSSTDISSGYYTSDITDSTSYTSTSTSGTSSSSSSSSSGAPGAPPGRR